MWITAIVGMATQYAAAVLAVRFREKDDAGNYAGGPMFFIKNGLSPEWKWLGGVFAFFAALAAFGIGNSVQVNSIVSVLESNYDFPAEFTGGAIAFLVSIVIIGGVKRVAQVARQIIPVMVIAYIAVAMIIVILNVSKLPDVILLIFKEAFSGTAAVGGISAMVIIGVARGVFSNEAGLGSSAIAHASARTSPVHQGTVAVLGTFIDTIVVCSMTGFAIVLYWQSNPLDLTGANLTSAAFNSALPGFGNHFIAGSLVLFAFTTVLGWSYYGEKSIQYLLGVKLIPVYRVLWILMIIVVAFLDVNLKFLWLVSDTLNALMAVPNLLALVLLSPVVLQLTKSHFKKPKI